MLLNPNSKSNFLIPRSMQETLGETLGENNFFELGDYLLVHCGDYMLTTTHKR